MSRGNFKINLVSEDRTYETADANLPSWLKSFADEYEKQVEAKPHTVVDQVRERYNHLSIQDQMNAILNGNGPRYSSVEEAVADYQDRTGFNEFSKVAAALKVIEAGEEEAEKKTLKPEIFDKHPQIETYINNLIDTNKHIQVPAVLHSIIENFRRDGVTESDLKDSDVARYINQLLIQNYVPLRDDTNDTSLGRGVGVNDDAIYDANDPNRNPFATLMPKNIMR